MLRIYLFFGSASAVLHNSCGERKPRTCALPSPFLMIPKAFRSFTVSFDIFYVGRRKGVQQLFAPIKDTGLRVLRVEHTDTLASLA